MDFKELIQIALDALFANKLRTFLTALGIIIGTASVISMLSIGNGAKSTIENRITSLGANTITVSAGSTNTGIVSSGFGSAQTLIISDYLALKNKLDSKLFSSISPEQAKNYQLIYKTKNTNLSVSAVTPDYFNIKNYTLNKGSFFNDLQNDNYAKVIILGSSVATTLFDFENPINKQIQIGNQLFTVIGVLNSKGQSGFQNQDNVAFIPLETSYKMSGTDVLRSIIIQVKNQDDLTEVQNQAFAIMVSQHNVDASSPDFTVSNSQDTLETLSSVSNTFTYLLFGIASISLLVGGIGIMNTMIISVTERTKEIGLRKAIGAKDNLILMQFVIESVVLSSLGALIGVFFGVVISFMINKLGIMTTKLSINSILLSTTISVLVGLIFGIYPARKASILNPIQALRYE